jgi:hypothetical protein
MLRGDISNEMPRRVLVTTDVFSAVESSVKKRFKVLPYVHKDLNIRKDILSKLYLYTTRQGVTLEVISYELNHDQMFNLMEMLDNLGTNPFRYSNSYESIEHLVSNLPYRPEVIGVIDKPQNLLRYGHWGMEFNYL